MSSLDLVMTWTWPPDEAFVRYLDAAMRRRGLTFRSVDAGAIDRFTADALNGRTTFRWLLDRASDEHPAFLPLAQWVESCREDDPHAPRAVNPHGRQSKAADKAAMHRALTEAGVNVPHTIILPPFASRPGAEPDDDEMRKVGLPFVIKPAFTTGGGNGVITGVMDVGTIAAARASHPNEPYLIQETVRPAYLGDFRAWFRVFYVCGRVFLCWWDDRTHVYDPVDPDDERFFGLRTLREAATTIARIAGIRFFSTELVMTTGDRLVAVDYVNEMCDLRPQSEARNGVPDRVVGSIAESIADFASSGAAGQGVIP